MKTTHTPFAPKARQSGFTIVEMMVALAISLVVMLGFAASFVNIKQTFIAQDKLGQLQDNERLAMALLTGSAQEAGYFPSPATLDNTQIIATPSPTYGGMSAGQAVFGMAASGATVPESLSMAFAASANDGLITCQGHTISAADTPPNGSVSVRNIFFVDPTAQTLNCITMINGQTSSASASVYGGGDSQPLVTNVASMSVAYGVDGGSGSVVGYYPASSPGLNWASVMSLRVTLNFVNPNDATKLIPWVQTINLLNR
jgi:type IV pilus assembly protein PilW